MERLTGKGLSNAEVAEIIGEGMHTGLRKGTEAADSHDLWKAISDSTTGAWSDAAAFCAYGLSAMGLRVIEVDA